VIDQFMTWVQGVSPTAIGVAMCAVIAAYLVYHRYRNRAYKSL